MDKTRRSGTELRLGAENLTNKPNKPRIILLNIHLLAHKTRSCLTRLLWRCTCSQNAHLRLVNSAFLSFVRLKLALVIQLHKKKVTVH